ncbi:MAG: ribonuclease Y [Gemmatimonadetes bacterium]|nr:ribonuclease Y [Gemmatimonadota bacterium]
MGVQELLLAAGAAIAGVLVGILGYRSVLGSKQRDAAGLIATARAEADRLSASAKAEADKAKAASLVEGKMEALKLREEVERDMARRREEVERVERRLEDRDRTLTRRTEEVDKQAKAVAAEQGAVSQKALAIDGRLREIDALVHEQRTRLERVAGLSVEEARREFFQRVEDEARSQAAAIGRDIKEQAKKNAEREAKRIIAMSIQRVAAEHTAETTVAAVALSSDELKGRIIGREGRNIRAFEMATGVDLIIDDTPDTVIVSCFDPIRREVGRRALDALITDGRIHPGRIEEIVKKVQKDLEEQLVELGEQAAYETGIHGLHPEMIKLIGRMRYRTSYGQNIYEHSKEVAWIAGMMAAELHLDVQLAKRGGLLHDIGKVLTHDNEGTHVQLGVEVATKYREQPGVINCIAAHHDDVPHESAESVLVQAADAISGSRPGARREAFETYVKRLTELEEIATSFQGVDKVNAIQAGREVRVIVVPEKVDDAKAQELAEAIAKRIEGELQYPGQIRVTVIRETRASGVAK